MDRQLTTERPFSDVSRISDVSISAYLRTSPIVPGQNRNDMGNDLFLGGIKCALHTYSYNHKLTPLTQVHTGL